MCNIEYGTNKFDSLKFNFESVVQIWTSSWYSSATWLKLIKFGPLKLMHLKNYFSKVSQATQCFAMSLKNKKQVKFWYGWLMLGS